ncbi:MAG: hypothetical protein JOZ36_13130 [Acidobacteria bacterium]|nr:hypothetical protein [Acidobacteriota bacterium]
MAARGDFSCSHAAQAGYQVEAQTSLMYAMGLNGPLMVNRVQDVATRELLASNTLFAGALLCPEFDPSVVGRLRTAVRKSL